MKLTGKVALRDLEGGIWVLEADDGQTYELAGADRKIKKDGQRVEVEGAIHSRAATVGMVGPVLSVRSYRFL